LISLNNLFVFLKHINGIEHKNAHKINTSKISNNFVERVSKVDIKYGFGKTKKNTSPDNKVIFGFFNR